MVVEDSWLREGQERFIAVGNETVVVGEAEQGHTFFFS
jgi:hypothetical protein